MGSDSIVVRVEGASPAAAPAGGVPLDHDATRWIGLDHVDAEAAGEIVKVPRDIHAWFEPASSVAGREIPRQLLGVGDSLIHLGTRARDADRHGEGSLRDAPLTTGQLCSLFSELDRTTVLQHLRVLDDAELVTRRKVGRERHVTLAPLPIKRIYDRWISGYTEAAVELLDRLDRRSAT